MELLQLQYFQKVAQLEHLTKAAQELHIAQPALSKTIARLEKDLGVPLFDRQKRQIKLNTAGRLFLKQVDIALAALEEGKRQIQDQAELEQQRIVLASINYHCDAELVGSFLTLFPDKNLLIKQTDSENQNINLLQNGKIDFFVTSLPITYQAVDYLPFVIEEILLAVPSSHRLAKRKSIQLHEVADEPFVGVKSGNPFREITNEFCIKAGFQPSITCEVDRLTAVSSFVQRGIGVAFLTNDAKQPEDHVVLLPIEQPICQRTFKLVWWKNRYLSKVAQQFRDYLQHDYEQAKKLHEYQTP